MTGAERGMVIVWSKPGSSAPPVTNAKLSVMTPDTVPVWNAIWDDDENAASLVFGGNREINRRAAGGELDRWIHRGRDSVRVERQRDLARDVQRINGGQRYAEGDLLPGRRCLSVPECPKVSEVMST